MSVGGIAGSGPFRGFVPYDESSTALFFGRSSDIATVCGLVTQEAVQSAALVGESGVGKTSLLRAGVLPNLMRQGVLGLYLGAYETLDAEVWQAASRARAEAPTTGESAAHYLGRLAQGSRAGTLLVLDHLEKIVGTPAAERLGALLAAVTATAGPRLRVLFCIDSGAFHRLESLRTVAALAPIVSAHELTRLPEAQVAQVLEQTAVQTGTFFEAGLSTLVAADLCRQGPCLPLDLQLVARTLVDLRLTSIRRYERSGGAELLARAFFERVVEEAGGPPARQVLRTLASGAGGETTLDDLAERTRLPRSGVDQAISAFASRGVVAKREGERGERYGLQHPALAPRIEEAFALDAARAKQARQSLRRRGLAGGRLSLRELYRVRRHLGGALAAEEKIVVTRSLRRSIFHVVLGASAAVGLILAVLFDLRSSYSLDFTPSGGAPDARLVIRAGRPSLSFLYFLPAKPRFGSVLADTGIAATALAPEMAARVTKGRATGTLERGRKTPVPAWLRAVLDGLRPMPRGVALVLLGDANGVISLKQAFAEPQSRREALEALAVIGTGGAGEDEILAAALADPSAEIRRRGVEVAAAIDRRRGSGSHDATLKKALGDQAFEVRTVVLRECATLDPSSAAGILAVALADKDAGFRRLAEKEIMALADRSPAAAADAVRLALYSPDALARRTGLGLLEQIAARAPTEAATALGQIVADEKAPEEARVAALLYLRRSGVEAAKLQPILEKAVSPEASPRLRAAALPLYARLLDPAAAEQMAVSESKGSPASRATGAAVWGALAAKHPDAAAKALKGFLYDPAPEVRTEAARGFGYLKREGAGLIQKALLDPNPEVQRAAVDSAVMLGTAQPYAVPEMLGRALRNVRPALRRSIVEALGKIGQDRPAMVIPPLARAVKEGDPATRAAAAVVLCSLARKNAAATAPYLRLAARDADRDVRTAAASCVGNLAEGDPKSAARMAAELAAADEVAVRTAAAKSLGALVAKARDLVLPPLLKLAQDPDRGVRAAAIASLAAFGDAGAPLGKNPDDAERSLATTFAQGDVEERLLVLRAAARNGMAGVVRQAAADGDESVRLEAVRAAASLTPPALDLLQSAVEDRSTAVRAEAIRRLATASGSGGAEVLAMFEGMLRSGDPTTRRAGALALGDLTSSGDAVARLLEGAIRQTSESVRAAAADALGRLAARQPDLAMPILEGALADPAHDVRVAAIRGLGAAWARRRSPAELATLLENSEADSARRMVALHALVAQHDSPEHKAEASKALDRVAGSPHPLARLAAQVGRAFRGAKPGDMDAFLDRLLGG